MVAYFKKTTLHLNVHLYTQKVYISNDILVLLSANIHTQCMASYLIAIQQHIFFLLLLFLFKFAKPICSTFLCAVCILCECFFFILFFLGFRQLPNEMHQKCKQQAKKKYNQNLCKFNTNGNKSRSL